MSEKETAARLIELPSGRLEVWFDDWDEAVDYANALNEASNGMRAVPQFWVDTRPVGPDLS